MNKIIRLLQSNRFSLTDEKQTQRQIASVLDAAGVKYEREVTLAPGDIVDFLLDEGLAIEVKIKGQRKAIYRQLERYAKSERVSCLLLATAVAMGLPETIETKPARVASLGMGWL